MATPKPLMIYASGYPRPYFSDAAEVKSASATPATWFPSSTDFRVTATNSGDAAGAATFDEVLKIVQGKPAGSINLLGLIGHGAGGPGTSFLRTFGLSGQITVNPPDVLLTAKGFIDPATIAKSQAKITPLRDRFAADGRIVVYACHTGADATLLDALSNAFAVCVEGFSDEIIWCFTWSTPKNVIQTRGKVFVDTNGMYAAGLVKCGGFNADITNLTPDLKSCVGVPGSTSTPTPKPSTR